MRISDKLELLAPAGDKEALEQAVYNGADAVYFGYKTLNARASAPNFDDLTKAVSFCHLFNVKTYLTLNIAIKDNELEEAEEIILEADKAGTDAFIIADLSLLPLIKKLAPCAQVHASTQMGIHNRYGAMLMEKMGFDRIILSRETTLDDIKDIREHIDIPIEVFAHGAICVSFSGSCLLSSITTGKSGNRGRCLQLCRKEYQAYFDGKKSGQGYLLSAKDLCLINNLEDLKKAGVNAIKIEGRLKRPEYVANCVREYRKAIDFGGLNDLSTLKKLFNRGDFTQGYLYEGNKAKIIYPFTPGHIGVRIGKVDKLEGDFIIIHTHRPINQDDGFKILRNKREVGGFIGKGAKFVKAENKLYIYRLKNTMGAKADDDIALTNDADLNNQSEARQKKLDVKMDVKLMANQKTELKAACGAHTVTVCGDMPQKAITSPLSHNQIKNQLQKTGGTIFTVEEINIDTDNNSFLPLSKLNELKRKAISELENQILSAYIRKPSRPYSEELFINYKKSLYKDAIKSFNSIKTNADTGEGDKRIFIEIKDIRQLTKFLQDKIKNIVYAPDNYNKKDCIDFYNFAKREENNVFIKLPVFVPSRAVDILKDICITFDGIICNNYYGIMLSLEYNKLFIPLYNLNITNTQNPLLKYCYDYMASMELNLRETENVRGMVYAYGHLPLMYLVHCPLKTLGRNCSDCGSNLVFRDKRGYYIINKVCVNSSDCLHIMKNGIVTDVGSRLAQDKSIYIDLTEKEEKDIRENIVKDYINNSRTPQGVYTLNHLKRGVK